MLKNNYRNGGMSFWLTQIQIKMSMMFILKLLNYILIYLFLAEKFIISIVFEQSDCRCQLSHSSIEFVTPNNRFQLLNSQIMIECQMEIINYNLNYPSEYKIVTIAISTIHVRTIQCSKYLSSQSMNSILY